VKTIINIFSNLIDRHDITEILLKVALNTITTLKSDCSIEFIPEDFMSIEKNHHKKLYQNCMKNVKLCNLMHELFGA
jgi:hypothetical protein